MSDSAVMVAAAGGAAALIAMRFATTIPSNRRVGGSMTWSNWSLTNTVEIFCLLSFGPATAILVVAIGYAAFDLGYRRRPVSAYLNAVDAVTSIAIAGFFYELMGGRDMLTQMPLAYAVGLAVIALHLIVQWTVLATSVAVTSSTFRRTFSDQFREIFRESAPFDTLEELFGLGIALMWLANPWLLPIVVPFAASIFIAVRYMRQVDDVTERALESFANVVDERDTYTYEHSTRVCEYAMLIGEELGWSEQQLKSLYWTSRLHDLGKVAVDNAILNKPGKLTDEEYEVMKSHPVVSARILRAFSFSDLEADIVLCHHERVDGRGYLRRNEDDVPFEAFVIAVADAYDAMTSERPYRSALPHVEALAEIERGIGVQFHADAARPFIAAMRDRLDISEEALANAPENSPGGLPDVGDDIDRSLAA